MRVLGEMIRTPIWVVIPVWHTAQGPLCWCNARLPRNLVKPCAGNEEVDRCPDSEFVLIRLRVRVWEFSRDGYPYRCTLLCYKPAFARSPRVIRHPCGPGPTGWRGSNFSLVCDGPVHGWIRECTLKLDSRPCMPQDASQLAVPEHRWRSSSPDCGLGMEKTQREFSPLLSFVPHGFRIQRVEQSLSMDLICER